MLASKVVVESTLWERINVLRKCPAGCGPAPLCWVLRPHHVTRTPHRGKDQPLVLHRPAADLGGGVGHRLQGEQAAVKAGFARPC